ncbi:hypothetical protein WA158_008105 [Blastocystis sp. Blastoise]
MEISHNNHINIFGGYTDQSWDSSCAWKPYSKEFLFTLSNEHGIPPTKYDYTDIDTECGILCSMFGGPSFGGGCDIEISDDCHNNYDSYCCLRSYADIHILQKHSIFVNTKVVDSVNYFKVEDYEVWGRI